MKLIIELKGSEPVASGGRRFVFAHPDDPALIVKVYRPDFRERYLKNLSSLRQRWRRYKEYVPWLNEVREHLALCAAEGRPPKHMQNLVGFAETDYGLGLVYEAVLDGDGGYAPTLREIIQQRLYSAEIQTAFLEFRRWLIDSPIVVTDLRPANFVCARDEWGKPYFVLIDGVGEKTLIPIKGLVRWLNRRSKRRHVAKCERKFGIPQQPNAPA